MCSNCQGGWDQEYEIEETESEVDYGELEDSNEEIHECE